VLQQHQFILGRYIEIIESVEAHIYTIGFNETRSDYLEVMRVLARNTGGTYRRIRNIGGLSATGGDASNGAFARLGRELDNELVLRAPHELEPEHTYDVQALFRFPDPTNFQVLSEVTTPPFSFDTPPRPDIFDPIPLLIAGGITLIVVFLLLVLLVHVIKKRRAEKAKRDERAYYEWVVAQGQPFCKTCYRKMQPDWQACMFCQMGMAPLAERPQEMIDAEEAQKKLDEIDGKVTVAPVIAGTAGAVALYATTENKNLCKTCGRVMAPEWKECMFARPAGACPAATPGPCRNRWPGPWRLGPRAPSSKRRPKRPRPCPRLQQRVPQAAPPGPPRPSPSTPGRRPAPTVNVPFRPSGANACTARLEFDQRQRNTARRSMTVAPPIVFSNNIIIAGAPFPLGGSIQVINFQDNPQYSFVNPSVARARVAPVPRRRRFPDCKPRSLPKRPAARDTPPVAVWAEPTSPWERPKRASSSCAKSSNTWWSTTTPPSVPISVSRCCAIASCRRTSCSTTTAASFREWTCGTTPTTPVPSTWSPSAWT
jgi:hypothetical protein